LVRVAIGLVLLYDALFHWRYAIELYSTFGPPMPIFVRQIADQAQAEPLPAQNPHPPKQRIEAIVPVPIPAPMEAVLAHTLLIFALGSIALGWHTRISLTGAFFLSAWLGPLDLPGTFGKHSVVALHFLLLLSFSRSGAA